MMYNVPINPIHTFKGGAMDIKPLVAVCVTVIACVAFITIGAVGVSQREHGDHWARSFREGAGVRIVATLSILGTAIFLSIAGLLNEPLIALLSSLAGFTLGSSIGDKSDK